MTSRRAVVAALAGGTALAAMPATAQRRRAVVTPARRLLDDAAQDILQLLPTTATSLGVDTGRNAPLRGRLNDASPAGRAAMAAQLGSIRRRIAALDLQRLSASERLHVATLDYAAERGQAGNRFAYGTGALDGFLGSASPYVVSQLTGGITQVPEFLNSQHPVAGSADAEAYLTRLGALARTLDDETEVLGRDAARGVAPPEFIARKALGILKGYRAVDPAQQPAALNLARKAGAAGLTGDWAARAAQLIGNPVYPALDRQIAALERATRGASSRPGVDRLPEGEAYYAFALKQGTTTDLSAAEVHRTGLAQNDEIKAQMDAILRAQGRSSGSVGQRLIALSKDPRFLYPNTDAGRATQLAYAASQIDACRALLPRISKLRLAAPIEVRRVPPDIQDGAAFAYMNFASLDGKRPAIYYLNQRDPSLRPKFELTTLAAHEGLPGHGWQGAYLAENARDIPLTASLTGFNAFVEGWALYAEQLMDEEGLYAANPFARLGYLQAQQFRAIRLVVDTGIHALGWSRDRAVDFMTNESGRPRGAAEGEIDRYAVWPGQACGYKVGHNEIVRLREDARRRLGPRFDARDYNDTLVATGGVPLALLPGVVDGLVARGGQRA